MAPKSKPNRKLASHDYSDSIFSKKELDPACRQAAFDTLKAVILAIVASVFLYLASINVGPEAAYTSAGWAFLVVGLVMFVVAFVYGIKFWMDLYACSPRLAFGYFLLSALDFD